MRPFSNVIGFDDGPFEPDHRGDVLVVGTVFAGARFDGVVTGKVRRDGANSTRELAELVTGGRFREHLQLVLLHGIALAGFNVVDLPELHRLTGLPVLVVCRRQPDLDNIETALRKRVPGGARKWRKILAAGPMEPAGALHMQRQGIEREQALATIRSLARYGNLPEPLRVAHLVAGAMVRGQSRGGA